LVNNVKPVRDRNVLSHDGSLATLHFSLSAKSSRTKLNLIVAFDVPVSKTDTGWCCLPNAAASGKQMLQIAPTTPSQPFKLRFRLIHTPPHGVPVGMVFCTDATGEVFAVPSVAIVGTSAADNT
jgi:hypothetical protein